MDNLINDKRFAHIARDPKYKRIPRKERKVKIDKRFQSMFENKNFAVHYTVDKRGRPIHQTSSENLRKYYELSSTEEEEDEIVEKEKCSTQMKDICKKWKKKEIKKKKRADPEENDPEEADLNKDADNDPEDFSSNGELLRIKSRKKYDIHFENKKESNSDSETETESNANDKTFIENLKSDLKKSKKELHNFRKKESSSLTNEIKKKLKDLSVNYARGEGVLMTDSSSDEESSELSDEEEIEHNWGELDKEAETTDEITNRLAVCNMDWDRIRAADLMVLFNSFLPNGGCIHSVTIYPSEFGLQRMKEEEIRGPIELTEISEKNSKDEDENEEGQSYHMEKLRQYQLNRLKYFYAVVDFDSAETANKVYTECDGKEYESTATKLDLRFIPNDMEFDQTSKEICDKLPEFSKYQPRLFTTTALQQAKVQLTWDETNPTRKEIAQKINSGKLDEVTENDLQVYLASESSDSEPDEQTQTKKSGSNSEDEKNVDSIEKYKSLLKEIEEKEEEKRKKDVEMEFTWGIATKEKAEKLVQERLKKEENLTPFEQYLEKRKAKKKAKLEQRNKLKGAKKDGLSSGDSEVSDSDDDKINTSSYRKRRATEDDNLPSSSDNESEERRKAELELLLMDENEDGKQHFNMKKIEEMATMTKSKRKRLLKKKNGQDQIVEDNFEVNVQDPRFSALFTSHHFNIDPADSHYRKTKGTEALVKEKLKRRAGNDSIEETSTKKSKTKDNIELQTLIKTVKKNAKNLSKPIK